MRALLGTLLLLLSMPAAHALDSNKSITQYAHRIWGQEEGLLQPTIYSIVQMRDGFLWLGTQDSLIRFDGVRFHEFQEGNSPLHGRLIRQLAEDAHGNLWAASLGGGMVRIAPDGSWRQFTKRTGLAGDSVFCLANGRDGAMWACTTEGLSRIEQDHVRTFTTRDGLPSNRIRAACETSDGTLWVAGLDFGLSRFNGAHFTSVELPGIGPRQNITALTCAHDDTLWIGTTHGLLHKKAFSVDRYPLIGSAPDDEVSALLETKAGTLWIGTSDGMRRWQNGEMEIYRTRDGLSHSQVLALCLDREGTLWAGTKNGLDQFTDGYATPFTTNEGLSSNDSGPVLEDHAGRLWVGTLDRGLNVFDGRRFRWITRADGLLSDRVLSLAAGAANDIWVGTSNGVNRIVDGRVAARFDARSGLRGEVRSLFVDARGTVWASANGELRRLEGGQFVSASVSPAISATDLRPMPIFDGSENPGLFLLQDARPSFLSIDVTHAVECFWYDAKTHSLWIGTLGSGLVRWRNGSLAHIYTKDGLYDARIYSLLQGDGDDLWLASSKGIFRVSERELDEFADGRRASIQSYPFSTGQLRFECRSGVQPATWRTQDGRLWFSTSSGIVVVNPRRILANRVPPPASVTALVANGRRIAANRTPRLKAHEANNIEIRYAGLSFVSPEKVTFRYRLEGYDRDWVDAGSRREAFYTNLPPRDFEFQVEARNADGVWSTAPASLRFMIEPRFYQRWWFFPLLAVLLALAVVAAIRLRIRRIRTRFALVLAERTRIARELHDTLLQGLSGITMQLQALATRLPIGEERRVLSEIIRDAARSAAEARQSLWGLRTGSASPDFSDRLTALVQQVVGDRHISVLLAIEPVSLAGLPDCEFQLLRIAREALTNTLKHAGALHLRVALAQVDGALQLSIEDDGSGFVPGSENGLHFGLRGMQERAAEIGAELEVTSSPETGTRVHVSLPLGGKLATAGNHSGFETHPV